MSVIAICVYYDLNIVISFMPPDALIHIPLLSVSLEWTGRFLLFLETKTDLPIDGYCGTHPRPCQEVLSHQLSV